MPPALNLDGLVSDEASFNPGRSPLMAGVQSPQLRRTAFALIGLGAGLAPIKGDSAHAALAKAVTDGADTLLMLVGSALALLMTPGLAFFYGGFSHSKNILNMMMSLCLMGLIGVLCVVIGYSFAFHTVFTSPFIGGLDSLWLNGVGVEFGDAPLADGFNLGATSSGLFQGMFAITTSALISGAMVEGIIFKDWFWSCLFWCFLVDSPMTHKVRVICFLGDAERMLAAIDFDGSTVVQIALGFPALVAAAMLGPRLTWPASQKPPIAFRSSCWVPAFSGSAGSASTVPA